MAHQAPPMPTTTAIVSEGDSEAFIPYPPLGDKLEHVPINVRPEVHYYISRMAFLPNAIKLYLHNPWSAEPLIRLNNQIMRGEQGTLSEEFKYKLAFIASRDNECTYCTAHHAETLRRAISRASSASMSRRTSARRWRSSSCIRRASTRWASATTSVAGSRSTSLPSRWWRSCS
jgi:AhpD family alkylhydroperoxidase